MKARENVSTGDVEWLWKVVSAIWPKTLATPFLGFLFSCLAFLPVQAQDSAPTPPTKSVRMTVTVRLLDQSKRMPDVKREDVIGTTVS